MKGNKNMNYEEYTLAQLRQLAKEKGIKNVSKLKREELYEILKKDEQEDAKMQEETNDVNFQDSDNKEDTDTDNAETRMEEGYTLTSSDRIAEGILEILPDGYGFLRGENYLSTPKDIYISPVQTGRCKTVEF